MWLLGLGESGQNLSRALPGAVGHVFVSKLLLEQLWTFHWHLRTMPVHVVHEFFDVISWSGRNLSLAGHFPGKKTRLRKYQCLPNLRIQLPLQNKQVNKYCIFKYSKIRPIPACKKIHNRRTLCLLLHGLKLALDVGEKKRSRETPPYKTMFKHFYHDRFIRSQCML